MEARAIISARELNAVLRLLRVRRRGAPESIPFERAGTLRDDAPRRSAASRARARTTLRRKKRALRWL